MRRNKILRSFLCCLALSVIALGYYLVINGDIVGSAKDLHIGCFGAWLGLMFPVFTICAVNFLIVTIFRIGIAIIHKDEHPSYDPPELMLFRIAGFITLFFSFPLIAAFGNNDLNALIYAILFSLVAAGIFILSLIVPFIIKRKIRR